MKTDFGEWTIPTKWEEVTVKQYQELERIYDKEKPDIRDIVAVLANKERKDIDELPTDFFETLLKHIAFIAEKAENVAPTNTITIAGETYQINIMEKLKTGEFVDSQTALEGDKHNYALLFAILCRKAGEIYNDDFIANVLPDREKMFEEQPITNILPLVGFFLQLWTQSSLFTLLFSKVEEAIDQLAENIKSSPKIGIGKRCYLRWQMKKLKNSLQSVKSI